MQHECNATRTQNHLVHLVGKRTLNHLGSLGKWLSVGLQTRWLWVRVPLQSLKLEISPVSTKKFFDIQAIIEWGFPLMRVGDTIKIYSLMQHVKTLDEKKITKKEKHMRVFHLPELLVFNAEVTKISVKLANNSPTSK